MRVTVICAGGVAVFGQGAGAGGDEVAGQVPVTAATGVEHH